MSAYTENGFKDRGDYLGSLKAEYPAELVEILAESLGPTEDFDGLVTMLEDHADEWRERYEQG